MSQSSIGPGIDRHDGPAKITGRARYAAEFALPDMLHAVLVQATIPHGAVSGFGTDAAAGMPGVVAIITPDNAEKLHIEKDAQQTVTRPLLQDAQVLYNGQAIALVVAATLEQAESAARALAPTYQTDAAALDLAGALGAAYVPRNFRNGQRDPDSSRGDPDGAYREAAVKIDATFNTPVEYHNPMEPHATLAHWDGDTLTVWTATQGISGVHKTLCGFFDLPADKVRVICPFVGGGFGSKGNAWPPIALAAMAARRVGRPVKLVLSREQMYYANGYRPQTLQTLQLAADRQGNLAMMRHDTFSGMSDPAFGEYSEPCGLSTEMLYECGHVAVSHRLVPLNFGFPTYMRAPGEAPGVFALEVAMDELATALAMDPLALRLKNYAERDGHENKPFSDKQLRACYSKGAEAFGWARRNPKPRAMRDGHWLVGMGMATATYPVNRSAASAKVRLGADGTVQVRSGTQDLGTGTYTVMAQVAADALGISPDRVSFLLGDSRFPAAPVSGGSQTVASVGPAVLAACDAVRGKILALAKSSMGHDVAWNAGDLVGKGRRVPFGQFLAQQNRPALEEEAHTDSGHGKDTHSLHSFGAQFCEVRVDEDLGEIRISRFLGVFDGGHILNSKTARSQLLGGITFGIGMALLEQALIDKPSGRIANANISEYLVPVNADIPAIETMFIPSEDRVANPLGVKGLGELPMVGAAAAVVNAVYHATGLRVRNLPVRIEDMLKA